MKLFLLSAFGVLVAMSVAAPPAPTALEVELQKLKQIADERAKLFSEFMGERRGENVEDEAESPSAPAVPRANSGPLRLGGLGKASLQPASGLQSGARGLTPENEWRRMFPHKPGYSR